jgi:anti-sigma B factor antagonist
MSVLGGNDRSPAAHGPGERIAVLGASDEIDAAEAAELQRAGAALLGTARTVAVDLSGVTFFGSRGISALLALHHAAGESGADLWIITGEANRAVLRPLALTGVDRVLRIVSAAAQIPGDGEPRPRPRA